MPTLKYSISTIAPGSINSASVRRIKIVDNITGDVHLFPADSTYIFMKVFVTNSDYRFYFQFPREDQQLIIMISELNDINGTAPAGNNQTTDLASIISLINV